MIGGDDNLERKVQLGGTLHEFILRSAGNKKIIEHPGTVADTGAENLEPRHPR